MIKMINAIKGGVYPTMLTPFTSDNKIDYNAVSGILDYYAKNKVDGIFAICQSSEIFYLSFEERLALLKYIKDNLPEGMSLVASGHVADDIDTQIKEAKAFCETGIDAYVFISNRFAAQDEGDDVFLANYEKAVKALGDIPVGMYECPYPYKRVIMPGIIKECCDYGNFAFIKDTCCDINLIREKLRAAEGTSLGIFNANGATLYESLKAGCAGYSGVMANFHPDLYVRLCHTWQNSPDEAQIIADFLSFASTIELQQYPVNAKYHMKLSGVDMEIYSRTRDCSTFTAANKKEIEAMIRTEDLFRKMLKND